MRRKIEAIRIREKESREEMGRFAKTATDE